MQIYECLLNIAKSESFFAGSLIPVFHITKWNDNISLKKHQE